MENPITTTDKNLKFCNVTELRNNNNSHVAPFPKAIEEIIVANVNLLIV
jgi:hypothetical protein